MSWLNQSSPDDSVAGSAGEERQSNVPGHLIRNESAKLIN